MDRYQYLLLMGACVLVTLPLEFVVGARVWRRPRRLAVALSPAFAAVRRLGPLGQRYRAPGSFSERYTVGVELPGGMAIEELVFFTVIPVCATPHPRGGADHPAPSDERALMPIYPTLAVRRPSPSSLLELRVLRTGIFRDVPTGSRWRSASGS